MKKILTFATAALCALTAAAQSGRCVNETPALQGGLGTMSFISPKTWKVGNQTWSDAVTATNCRKETYYGVSSGEYNADCRENGDFGDLFSWCAVSRFQKQLCPAPWRVPTTDDFAALDNALQEGKGSVTVKSGYGTVTRKREMLQGYISYWGDVYSGFCSAGGALYNQGAYAGFWSQTENVLVTSYSLHFNANGGVNPQSRNFKDSGLALRCVK